MPFNYTRDSRIKCIKMLGTVLFQRLCSIIFLSFYLKAFTFFLFYHQKIQQQQQPQQHFI